MPRVSTCHSQEDREKGQEGVGIGWAPGSVLNRVAQVELMPTVGIRCLSPADPGPTTPHSHMPCSIPNPSTATYLSPECLLDLLERHPGLEEAQVAGQEGMAGGDIVREIQHRHQGSPLLLHLRGWGEEEAMVRSCALLTVVHCRTKLPKLLPVFAA